MKGRHLFFAGLPFLAVVAIYGIYSRSKCPQCPCQEGEDRGGDLESFVKDLSPAEAEGMAERLWDDASTKRPRKRKRRQIDDEEVEVERPKRGKPLRKRVEVEAEDPPPPPPPKAVACPPVASASKEVTKRDCPTVPPFLAIYDHRDLRPLHLIWMTHPVPASEGGEISEAIWIRDSVLSKVRRPIVQHFLSTYEISDIKRHDIRMEMMMPDSLVVCLFLPHLTYVNKLKAAGHTNVGFYQMGDELMSKATEWYDKADYVFRNYYNKEYLDRYPNLKWVTLGIKSGIGAKASSNLAALPLASQRPNLCNFLGSIRADRQDLLNVIRQKRLGCKLHVGKWEGRSNPHAFMYRSTLELSKFTLSPWGNNPETMRFYEALELGSIPVVRKFKNPSRDPMVAFGEHPIPVVNSWDELPALFQRYSDPEKLDALQLRILRWWHGRKEKMFQSVADTIDASFEKKYGPKHT